MIRRIPPFLLHFALLCSISLSLSFILRSFILRLYQAEGWQKEEQTERSVHMRLREEVQEVLHEQMTRSIL